MLMAFAPPDKTSVACLLLRLAACREPSQVAAAVPRSRAPSRAASQAPAQSASAPSEAGQQLLRQPGRLAGPRGGGRQAEEGVGLGAESSLAASIDCGASVVSAAGTSRPVQLAETVFDGVRAKLRRLQEDVQQRDAAIVSLNQVGC